MREIKFQYIYELLGVVCRPTLTLEQIEEGLAAKDSFPSNAKIIAKRQYTGLKDCNGVEVYEGDILVITTDRDGSYMNKVEEYQGIFGFFNMTCKQIKNPSDWDRPHNKTDSGWFLSGFSNLAGFDYSKLGEVDAGGNQACVEVIGNIHETPELLEDNQ